MTEEYINLSDLKPNFIDSEYDMENNGKLIYQFQPESGTNKSIISKVGKFNKTPDILINQFNLSTRERCIITSCVYDEEEINKLEKKCNFPLIKIVSAYNNGQVLKPVGYMGLFFHTFRHVQEDKDLIEYQSTKDTKIYLEGLYSISYHFNEKKIILDKFKDFPGMLKVIDKMIKHLSDIKIRNLIENLFNSE